MRVCGWAHGGDRRGHFFTQSSMQVLVAVFNVPVLYHSLRLMICSTPSAGDQSPSIPPHLLASHSEKVAAKILAKAKIMDGSPDFSTLPHWGMESEFRW